MLYADILPISKKLGVPIAPQVFFAPANYVCHKLFSHESSLTYVSRVFPAATYLYVDFVIFGKAHPIKVFVKSLGVRYNYKDHSN